MAPLTDGHFTLEFNFLGCIEGLEVIAEVGLLANAAPLFDFARRFRMYSAKCGYFKAWQADRDRLCRFLFTRLENGSTECFSSACEDAFHLLVAPGAGYPLAIGADPRKCAGHQSGETYSVIAPPGALSGGGSESRGVGPALMMTVSREELADFASVLQDELRAALSVNLERSEARASECTTRICCHTWGRRQYYLS